MRAYGSTPAAPPRFRNSRAACRLIGLQTRQGTVMLRAIGCIVLIVVLLGILLLTGLLSAIF